MDLTLMLKVFAGSQLALKFRSYLLEEIADACNAIATGRDTAHPAMGGIH